ncbi:MAG: lamin tail domain-containing protein [Nanoarchaeota archaeon]|nr:lamin tail domain-containing protein [Nanoarchaeota archaeon]
MKKPKILIFFIIFIFIVKISSALIISEVMYDPECSDSYCEYIELYNNDSNSIDITDYTIGDDDSNDTLEGSPFIIPSYSYALITDQDTRIYTNYDIPKNIIWFYTDDYSIGNGLTNSETITLYDSNLSIISQLTYENATNGDSLSYIDETWQQTSPTPGSSNSNNEIIADYSKISISEFLPNPEGEDNAPLPAGEWIELYNSGPESLDLLGLKLYDNYGSEPDITISETNTISTTIIEPKSYLVIYTNGISSFLNNNNFEKITLKDFYGNILDEVTYSDSDEAISWSLAEGKWQKTKPTPGYFNEDNSSSTESELKIEEIYDLGSDKKAEWGDIIRVKLFVSKGNTQKEVVWMWIENDEERITKKSKFNVYEKFQSYTFTYPLMIPDNCNKEFLDGNYNIIVSGLDTQDEAILEIRDSPLCKELKEPSTRVKNLEYSITSIPETVSLELPFTTEVTLKNNQQENIELDIWSYPYSGSKQYVETEEKENLQNVILNPSEEKTIKLTNEIKETDKQELDFKIKLQKTGIKTPYELKDKVKIIPASEEPKTFKSPITGFTIYESSGEKAKRSAVFFFSGVLTFLLLFVLIKNGTPN